LSRRRCHRDLVKGTFATWTSSRARRHGNLLPKGTFVRGTSSDRDLFKGHPQGPSHGALVAGTTFKGCCDGDLVAGTCPRDLKLGVTGTSSVERAQVWRSNPFGRESAVVERPSRSSYAISPRKPSLYRHHSEDVELKRREVDEADDGVRLAVPQTSLQSTLPDRRPRPKERRRAPRASTPRGASGAPRALCASPAG